MSSITILGQTLYNVLSDAFKFASKDGHVFLDFAKRTVYASAYGQGLAVFDMNKYGEIQGFVDWEVAGWSVTDIKELLALLSYEKNSALTVTLTPDTYRYQFISGKTKFSTNLYDSVEFFSDVFTPVLSDFYRPLFNVSYNELDARLNAVKISRATEDSRPVLNFINMQFGPSPSPSNATLTLACADGYRLAIEEMAVESLTDDNHVIEANMYTSLLTAMSLVALPEKIKVKKGETAIVPDTVLTFSERDYLGDKYLRMDTSNATFYLPYGEGRFPDFKVIVPRSYDYEVDGFSADELLGAVKQAMVLSADSAKCVKFMFMSDIVNDSTLLYVVGKKNETLVEREVNSQSPYNQNPAHFYANGKYVIDWLNSVKGKTVKFAFNNQAPIVLTTDIVGSQYIVMPMSGKW